MSRAYCRMCRRNTTWIPAGSFNGTGPLVNLFRCRTCGHDRMQMADVPDADGLPFAIVDTWLRQSGNTRASIDYDDAIGHLRLHLWVEYRKWDPTRGVPFLSYATGILRHRLTRWIQDNVTGRSGPPKPHVGALSLDAPIGDGDSSLHPPVDRFDSMVAALGPGAGDPSEGRVADLTRLLSRGSRRDARAERELGIGPAEGD